MIYRLGTTADLEEIENVVHKAIVEMESHNIYQWEHTYPIRKSFEEDLESGNLYVGIEDSRIAVIYIIRKETDRAYDRCRWYGKKDKAYILHRMCVSPEYQNKGIAGKTMIHLENQVRDMGYDSVRLGVFSQNSQAVRLYTRRGYEMRGTADWRKGRYYLMEKAL